MKVQNLGMDQRMTRRVWRSSEQRRSCERRTAAKEQHILPIPVRNSAIVPDLRPQSIAAHVIVLREKRYPIGLPLLVYMIHSALTRYCRGKHNHRGQMR